LQWALHQRVQRVDPQRAAGSAPAHWRADGRWGVV